MYLGIEASEGKLISISQLTFRKPKSPMERPPRVGGDATPASKAKKKAKKVPKTPMTEPRKVRGPLVLASAGKGNTAGGKAKGMKKRRLST